MGEEVLERYAHMLNCKVMKIIFLYLGIPTGANPSCRDLETYYL